MTFSSGLSRALLLALACAAPSGCAFLREAALESDSGEARFIEDNYGKPTQNKVYFAKAQDFQDVLRIFKEEIVTDNSLTDAQKESRMAEARGFDFEPDRYLVYFFRLHQPALVAQKDFHIDVRDPSGNDLVEKRLMTRNRVEVTGNGETMVSYNYVWVMKLAKPFNRDNYPAGSYSVTVASPDDKKARYKLEL